MGTPAPIALANNIGTYFCTGAEQPFVVPAGVTHVRIAAVGGAGADGAAPISMDPGSVAPGGAGGTATGDLLVTPLQTLYVNVGCSASPGDTAGGFNGGGNGAQGFFFGGHTPAYDGGGGGGASDVRTISRLDGSHTPQEILDSRLIVAGGGGGGGGAGDFTTAVGGNGGAAGSAGANGQAGVGLLPGGAGGAGTFATGGTGGSVAGANGSSGNGGNGGDGLSFPTGGGGGGGGGYFGGGGGGGGDASAGDLHADNSPSKSTTGKANVTQADSLPISGAAGGGGGGGSGFVMPGALNAQVGVATVLTPPSVTITAAPLITKTFNPASLNVGDTSLMTITISNANVTQPLSGIGFTDTLPAGLTFVSSVGGTCTGPGSANATVLTKSGASLTAGTSCTVTIDVKATAPGVYTNITGPVSATESGNGATASGTLTANALPAPTFTKAFGAPSINFGATTSLTFSISNGNAQALTNLTFTDNLPAGLRVASPNGLSANTCGGGVTATPGSSTISRTGGSVAANGSCGFSVNVTAVGTGPQNNTTSTLTSTEANPAAPATASLTVGSAPTPPTISKSFSVAFTPSLLGTPKTPQPFSVGDTKVLSFTLTNPNAAVPLTGVGFTDNLPSGLVVASPNGLTGSCGGGSISAVALSSVISLTGATLPGGGSCTFTVKVLATSPGTKVNVTGPVSSTESGPGGTATATTSVGGSAKPPKLSKAFGAANLALNASTALKFTNTNPNASSPLSGIGFTDNLPAGLVVATPNGLSGTCASGTITATAGSSSISLSGATLAPAASCTFSVNVTGTSAGLKSNTTSSVSSNEAGPGAAAMATLTVGAATGPKGNP